MSVQNFEKNPDNSTIEFLIDPNNPLSDAETDCINLFPESLATTFYETPAFNFFANNSTLTATTIKTPNGYNFYEHKENTTTNVHSISSPAFARYTGEDIGVYCFSVLLKKNTHNFYRLEISYADTPASGPRIIVNLNTGDCTFASINETLNSYAFSKKEGNGTFRVFIVYTLDQRYKAISFQGHTYNGSTNNYLGNGTSSTYLGELMLEPLCHNIAARLNTYNFQMGNLFKPFGQSFSFRNINLTSEITGDVTSPVAGEPVIKITPTAPGVLVTQFEQRVNIIPDELYYFTGYVKDGGYGTARFGFWNNNQTINAGDISINLVTGTFGAGGTGFTNRKVKLETLANGWYRFHFITCLLNNTTTSSRFMASVGFIHNSTALANASNCIYISALQVSMIKRPSLKYPAKPINHILSQHGIASGNGWSLNQASIQTNAEIAPNTYKEATIIADNNSLTAGTLSVSFTAQVNNYCISYFVKPINNANTLNFKLTNSTTSTDIISTTLNTTNFSSSNPNWWCIQLNNTKWFKMYFYATNLTIGNTYQLFIGRTGNATNNTTQFAIWGFLAEPNVFKPNNNINFNNRLLNHINDSITGKTINLSDVLFNKTNNNLVFRSINDNANMIYTSSLFYEDTNIGNFNNGSFTIEFIIKRHYNNNSVNQIGVFYKRSNVSGIGNNTINGYLMRFYGYSGITTLAISIEDTNSNRITLINGSELFPVKDTYELWHFTYDAEIRTMGVYKNSVLQTNTTITLNPNTTTIDYSNNFPFRLGALGNATVNSTDMEYALVAGYKKCFNNTDVLRRFNSLKSKFNIV